LRVRHIESDDVYRIENLTRNYGYGTYLRDLRLPQDSARQLLIDQMTDFCREYPETTWVAAEEDGTLVGLIGFRTMAWDTAHFGFNVARIEYLISAKMGYEKEIHLKKALLEKFDNWLQKQRIVFVSARIDASDISSLHSLENNGFRFIENLVTYSRDLRGVSQLETPKYSLRLFRDEDKEALTEIAQHTPEYSRFIVDTRFNRKKSVELYVSWALNSARSSADRLLILEIENKPLGFFTIRFEDLSRYFGMRICTWGLAGLSPRLRGTGLGYQLFLSTLHETKKEADIVYSGFVLRHIRVTRIHEKLGFTYLSSYVTLHRWT